MDNNQVPVMPVPGAMPTPGVVPTPDAMSTPGAMPTPSAMPVSNVQPSVQQPTAQSVASVQPEKKKNTGLIVSIVLAVVFFLLSVLFIVLFALAKGDYSELSDSVDLKIEEAVSEAKTEQALADAEEAKKDTRAFTGPTDYGQLSFEYPKSWSVYIASDASKGGDFVAYLNPIEIEPVSNSTVYALRVSILDKDFEEVTKTYQTYLKSGKMSMETVTVGGTTANRYTGQLPSTELNGVIVIFKIRDKTAVLRTDSALLVKDFDTVLSTVKFNA